MEDEKEIVMIEPIAGRIASHSVAVQVKLDEDATDQQIMNALDDACRAWASNINTGASLQILVGHILVAVKAREIHKREPWGNFDTFVQKEIRDRYGIDTRTAYHCVEIVTGLPELTPKEAKHIPAKTLLVAAQAVNGAKPEDKARVRRKVLRMVESNDLTANDFRAQLKDAKLLRASQRNYRIRLVTLTFQVPVPVAERWAQITSKRAASLVFAEWVEEHSAGKRKRPAITRLLNGAARSNGHQATVG